MTCHSGFGSSSAWYLLSCPIYLVWNLSLILLPGNSGFPCLRIDSVMLEFAVQTVRILTLASIGIILVFSAEPSWASENGNFYSIFVESFSTGEDAAKLVHTLQNKGYAAFVRYQSTTEEKSDYRVYIGKFTDKSQARDQINELVNSSVSGYYTIVELSELALQKIPSEYLQQEVDAVSSQNADSEKEEVKNDVPTTGKSNVKQTSYSLHIGSYLDYNYLKYEMERLQKHGLNPFWMRGFDHGLTWFRLYLGSYPDLISAENAGDMLIQKRIVPLYTVDSDPGIQMPPSKGDEKSIDTNQLPPGDSKMTQLPLPAEEDDEELSVENDDGKTTIEDSDAKDSAIIDAEVPDTENPQPSDSPPGTESGKLFPDTLNLSAGIRLSQHFVPEIDDFTITKTDNGLTERWYIDGENTVGVSLPVSVRINRFLSLEGYPEFSDTGVLNTFYFSLHPKVNYTLSNGIEPFAIAGLLYGVFDWQGPPGDFDDAFGWEVGFGVNYLRAPLRFGADILYRNIAFTYNSPGDQSVFSSSDQIDFSGYSISASLEYLF